MSPVFGWPRTADCPGHPTEAADPRLARPLIIAVSAYGQESERARSRKAGMDRHLIKPVDIEALIELLDRYTSASARADGRWAPESRWHDRVARAEHRRCPGTGNTPAPPFRGTAALCPGHASAIREASS
ncbi:MAG TPA: hypothetical protein VGH33_11255 [Isosphaeraceae bacterium]